MPTPGSILALTWERKNHSDRKRHGGCLELGKEQWPEGPERSKDRKFHCLWTSIKESYANDMQMACKYQSCLLHSHPLLTARRLCPRVASLTPDGSQTANNSAPSTDEGPLLHWVHPKKSLACMSALSSCQQLLLQTPILGPFACTLLGTAKRVQKVLGWWSRGTKTHTHPQLGPLLPSWPQAYNSLSFPVLSAGLSCQGWKKGGEPGALETHQGTSPF